MTLTIYHNPRCSKSRQTLQLIVAADVPHHIVKYLDDAPSATTILELAKALNLPLASLLRRNEASFKGATDLPDLEDQNALAQWLSANPIVLERPIVIDPAKGIGVIGRPPENVQALLPQ